MNFYNAIFDPGEYLQSLPDILIHEISKPPRPFDYDKNSHRIPIKYKNPDVRIIKLYYFCLIINNAYRKYLIY